jgi:hypothetical protein
MSFLRKTRFKVLFEGDYKIVSLFLFAELVLITLGMTIALQFDEWKDVQGKIQSEHLLLVQIQQEFLAADSSISSSYETYKSHTPSLEKVYKNCGYNQDNITSREFGELSDGIYIYNKLKLNNGILIEAINSGKLSLIQSDVLRNKLSSWGEHVEHIEYLEVNGKDQIFAYYNYSFNFTTYRDSDSDYYPHLNLGVSKMTMDINLLLNNRVFENQIGWLHYNNARMIRSYDEFLITPCREILNLIESELEIE